MALTVDFLIATHNFQMLSNRSKGVWLEANSSGELQNVNGFFRKCWFVLRNICSCGGLRERTAKTIEAVCKKFFDEICLNCPSPIDANTPLLARYRESIAKMGESVKRMSPKICDIQMSQKIKDLHRCPEIVEARLALDQGLFPSTIQEGISGSYILYNRQGREWAVFKPQEQEPGSGYNPKGFNENVEKFLSDIQIEPGTSCLREKAVYLLDHEHFSGVPLTEIAHLPPEYFGGHTRLTTGSFQKFVPNCRVAYDHYSILPRFLSSAQAHRIPAHEIHKLAILDIRTLNCDRHLKNYLVDPDWHIHPIDHGYTLPGNASNLRFSWMNFSQSKEPFSREELAYIERLDPKADVEILKQNIPSISREALFRVEVAGALLKKAALRGLTAYQIGELMCGKHNDTFNLFLNIFFPIPLDNPSYFERSICRGVGDDVNQALDQAIDNYLRFGS